MNVRTLKSTLLIETSTTCDGDRTGNGAVASIRAIVLPRRSMWDCKLNLPRGYPSRCARCRRPSSRSATDFGKRRRRHHCLAGGSSRISSQEVHLGLMGADDIIIIILFALRQLQVIPQIFYSTSQFTMLMLLIYTYTPCVDYSPY